MNTQSAQLAAIDPEILEEARRLFDQQIKDAGLDARWSLKLAIDAYEAETTLGRPGVIPFDTPAWVAEAMRGAVMPDGSICQRTVGSYAKTQSKVLAARPLECCRAISPELRRAMFENGFIYDELPDVRDGGDDTKLALYTKVTGYGLSKMLGIDLFDHVEKNVFPSAPPA